MRSTATVDPSTFSRGATQFLQSLERDRDVAKVVEGNDLICWTTDEEDRLLMMEGGGAPADHLSGKLIGRSMRECPHAKAYFAAKAQLAEQPDLEQTRVRWSHRGRDWVGTFTRTYSKGGRFMGIAALALPIDDVLVLT